MIFKTIESDVNKSGLALQLFKKNLSDIKNDFGNAKGIGGKLNSIFSSGLTDNDVKRIKEYNHLIEKGQNPQSAYYRALKNSSTAAQNLAQSAKGATVSQKSIDTALKTTSLSSKAAAVGMQALNVAMNVGIMLAVSLAVKGIEYLVTAQQRAIDTANELSEAWKTQQDTFSSNTASLEGLKSELASLSKGVDENGKNVKLSVSEYQRYKDIVKQIVDISPAVVKGYTAEGEAIIDNNTAIEEAIRLQKELNEQKRQEYLTKGTDVVKGARNEMLSQYRDMLSMRDDINKNFFNFSSSMGFGQVKDEFEKALSEIEGLNFGDYVTIDSDQIITYSDAIINKVKEHNLLSEEETENLRDQIGLLKIKNEEYQSSVDKITNLLTTYSQSDTQDGWHDKITGAYLDEFYNSIKDISSNSVLSFAEMKLAVQDLGAQFVDIQSQIPTQAIEDLKAKLADGSITSEEFRTKLMEQVNVINDLATKYPALASVLNLIANGFSELGTSAQESSNQMSVLSFALDDISNELTSFNDEISKVYSSMDLLDKASDEFANTGMISANTFKSLSDNNLLQYLQFTSDGLNILTDDLLNNEQAVKEKARADLAASLYADLLSLATNGVSDAERNARSPAEGAGNAAETMGNQFANSVSGILTATEALDAFNNVASGEEAGTFDFKGQEQQFNKLLGNYNSAVTAIQKMGSTTDSTANSFNRFSTATDKAAESAKKAAEEINQAMSKAQSDINSLLKMTISMLKQEYNDRKELIQDELKALQDRYDKEKELIESNKKIYEKSYDDRRKALEEEAEWQEKIFDEQKEALQDQLDSYQKIINKRLELLKTQESEHDYQKELLEKQKDVADLEADLAVAGLDTSQEGQRKKLELEETLAEKRKELEEFQHDRSIELQEDALNKELADYEEKINNKLDIVQKEEDKYNEIHDSKMEAMEREKEKYDEIYQSNLDRIQNQYDAQKSIYEQQINDIEDYVSKESNIRLEAIQLIENKNSELYSKLMQWNREYGDGIDASVRIAWENAYAALSNYNFAQIGVQGVLEMLVSKMDEFERSTRNAASAMQNLAQQSNAVRNTPSVPNFNSDSSKSYNGSLSRYRGYSRSQIQQVLSNMLHGSANGENIAEINELQRWLNQYHVGGIVTPSNKKINELFGLQSDEAIIKAKVGETILSPDDPQNAAQLMAKYINSNLDVADFANSLPNRLIENEISRNYPTTGISDLTKYERIDSRIGDVNIDYKFDVEGSIDTSTLPPLKKLLELSTEHTIDAINWQRQKSGRGRDMKSYSL